MECVDNNDNDNDDDDDGFSLHFVGSGVDDDVRCVLEKFVNPVTPMVDESSEYEVVQGSGDCVKVKLPPTLRQLPCEILYDTRGLDLFSQITTLDEYYLTREEKSLLNDRETLDAMVKHIPDHASVIELGCGSMEKTLVLLKGVLSAQKHIDFFAVDLDESSLRASLKNLVSSCVDSDTTGSVAFHGIVGSYEDVMSAYLPNLQGPKVFLWLGSSIGNFSRMEAVKFVSKFESHLMDGGDLFFVGIDHRNDPRRIALAYNDPQGVTDEFAMNGMRNLDSMLGSKNVFETRNFRYFAGYNDKLGRHEAYYQSTTDQSVDLSSIFTSHAHNVVVLAKGELVRFETSYKYSPSEIVELADGAHLNLIDEWTTKSNSYSVVLYQKPVVVHLNSRASATLPSLRDFSDAWRLWDALTGVIVNFDAQPIDLRHPMIFYVGHMPTFCDVQFSRALHRQLCPPQYYQTIFERGIDPVVENPNECHSHSDVPESWPTLGEIHAYRDNVRQRVRHLYENDAANLVNIGQVVHMVFEHYLMHIETFLYMLVQCDVSMINFPMPVGAMVDTPPQCNLGTPKWLHIDSGSVTIGMDERCTNDKSERVYGWDNEHPARIVSVTSFDIQHRPVSIEEYARFLKSQPTNTYTTLLPASWHDNGDGDFLVKTVYGKVRMGAARLWPVSLNFHQADAYREFVETESGEVLRIPTESELQKFFNDYGEAKHKCTPANYGFKYWCPQPLSDDHVHVMGSVWEWTSTLFDTYDGFKSSSLYPAYSSDFFDGLHNVVVGASWATHPRLAGRLRNFYQRSYPYAFIGVRFVRSSTN